MAFADIATEGVEKIYRFDAETQRHYLTVFCENVRDADVDVLMELKCFFIPNNDYLIPFFGKEVFGWKNDIYYDGKCKWNNQLVIPLFDVGGDCVAFVGFDFLTKTENLEQGIAGGPYYSGSSQSVFSSRKYLYYPGSSFDKAFHDGYIVLVDGMFDAINLYRQGINACSMLGSAVTWEKMMQLRFIPRLFVAMDNDRAGRRLYERVRKFRCDAKQIVQNVRKDADAVLCSEYSSEYLTGVRNAVKQNKPFLLHNKPEFRILPSI